VPMARTTEGWQGPAFRVDITRCDPLPLDNRSYPGWSVVKVQDGCFVAGDGWPSDLTDDHRRALFAMNEAAATIATAHLPKPVDPDGGGICVAWADTFVGPVPDALADVVARSLANRLHEMVPAIVAARRKRIADYEAGLLDAP
jgi:hypothetical protein